MATMKIKVGNFFRIHIWYPATTLLGKLGLMKVCSLCGLRHDYDAPWCDFTLDDGTIVQVCHVCADMSHEEHFLPYLNKHILGLRREFVKPITPTEKYFYDNGWYYGDGTVNPPKYDSLNER